MTAREVRVDTVGAAGSATGSSVISVPPCKLLGVRIDYHGSTPATTDVVISNMGRDVLNHADTDTDVFCQPREVVQTAAGTPAAAGDNLFAPFILHGLVTVTVDDCDALTDAVVVTLLLEK